MRSGSLQGFLTALEAAFAEADMPAPARAAVARVFAAARQPGPSGPVAGENLPVTALLPDALAPLLPRVDALGDLARRLSALAADLVWTTRKAIGPGASPGFATSHANCFLIGPGAIEARDDLWIGISLMAPGTRYPDHGHAPEEVYLALTPGEFWQGDAAWISPGPGGTVYNVPGIRHAMRAGNVPFLAIWVLPVRPPGLTVTQSDSSLH